MEMPEKIAEVTAGWFYEIGGERKGPVIEQEIKDLVSSGILKYGSRLWHQTLCDWRLLEETHFKGLLTAPPPITGTAINNKLVWWLAFTPLIGYFLEVMIASVAEISVDSLWCITLSMNIGLSILDEKKLQKAGHDTSKMGSSWLVPVYLFKRALILRQSKAYFIVWIVGLLLVVVFG